MSTKIAMQMRTTVYWAIGKSGNGNRKWKMETETIKT